MQIHGNLIWLWSYFFSCTCTAFCVTSGTTVKFNLTLVAMFMSVASSLALLQFPRDVYYKYKLWPTILEVQRMQIPTLLLTTKEVIYDASW